MSLTLSTQNFTEYEKQFFVTNAVIGLDTLNSGCLYLADSVKSDRYTLPVFSATTKLNPRTDFPVDNNTTVLSNRDIALAAFESYETFNPNIFENHWHKDQLTDKLLSRGLPDTFANYLATFYTALVFSNVENMIHMGSTGYTTSAATPAGANYSIKHFDGLIRQAIVGGALQVASPSAITSANIIAKMEAAKNLMPKALLSKAERYDRLKFMLSVEDFQKYEEALTSTSFKNNDTTEKGLQRYKGYNIEVLAGIPENTFYFCEATSDVRSNVHLALTSEENMTFEINRVQNNSNMQFYKSIMKMGVGIAKLNEFVIHTTKVAADFTA